MGYHYEGLGITEISGSLTDVCSEIYPCMIKHCEVSGGNIYIFLAPDSNECINDICHSNCLMSLLE